MCRATRIYVKGCAYICTGLREGMEEGGPAVDAIVMMALKARVWQGAL